MKLCPIFTIAKATTLTQRSGVAAETYAPCKEQACMFFNAPQGICTISGQRPRDENDYAKIDIQNLVPDGAESMTDEECYKSLRIPPDDNVPDIFDVLAINEERDKANRVELEKFMGIDMEDVR